MAGEGHINAINKVLFKKLNKTLQRRKDFKNRQIGNGSITELEFKEIDKKELELIKEKIRLNAKKYKQKMRIIFIIITVIVIILFYYLFSDFNLDFSVFSRQR